MGPKGPIIHSMDSQQINLKDDADNSFIDRLGMIEYIDDQKFYSYDDKLDRKWSNHFWRLADISVYEFETFSI